MAVDSKFPLDDYSSLVDELVRGRIILSRRSVHESVSA